MRRTHLALILAGVAALALGGTAIAARSHSATTPSGAASSGPHHGPGDDLDAAASYLGTTTSALLTQLQAGKTLAQVASATSGKSTSGLVAALVSHERSELADAVKAGRLTQAQADQIGASLQQRFTDFVNGVRPAFGPGPMHHGDGLQAAATYLGISVDALRTQLEAGKTLAQIANATSGRSASGLVDALVADATSHFGGAAPPDLRQRISDLVNGVRPAFGPPGGPGHFGHGPGDGGHWGQPGPRRFERSF